MEINYDLLPRFLDKEYFFHFKDCIATWAKHKTALWGYNRYPEMADHGFRHSLNVLENCLNILVAFPGVYRSLSDEEWFLLLSSCLLHDIGMDGDRKTHGIHTAERLRERETFLLLRLEDEEAILIGRLATYHMSKTPLNDEQASTLQKQDPNLSLSPIPLEAIYRGKKIRLRFLAALLSLADACDVQYSREGTLVDHQLKDKQNLIKAAQLAENLENQQYIEYLKSQTQHLKKHGSIQRVHFELYEILLDPVVCKFDGNRDVLNDAVEQISPELARSGKILANYGVIFKSVRISTVQPLLNENSQLLKADKLPSWRISIGSHAEALTTLIRQAYVMLRLDQIPQTGNWGLTIDKYALLNFPGDEKIRAQLPKYVREGSITHTAHALKGLYSLCLEDQDLSDQMIFDWIRKSENSLGLVEPEYPANEDEVRDYAKVFRHTATSLISIHYLLQIGGKQIASSHEGTNMKAWAIEKVQRLADHPYGWAHDPRMTYSFAYLIYAYRLLIEYTELLPVSRILYNKINNGIDKLLSMISRDNPWWCVEVHGNQRTFYSLFMLSYLLDVPQLKGYRNWLEKCGYLLSTIAKNRNKDGGISYSGLQGLGNYSQSDPGVSAMFINALSRYARIDKDTGEKLAMQLMPQTLDYLASTSSCLDLHSSNLLTHGYAAILELAETTNVSDVCNSSLVPKTLQKCIDEIVRMRKIVGNEDNNASVTENNLSDIITLTGAKAIKPLIQKDILK